MKPGYESPPRGERSTPVAKLGNVMGGVARGVIARGVVIVVFEATGRDAVVISRIFTTSSVISPGVVVSSDIFVVSGVVVASGVVASGVVASGVVASGVVASGVVVVSGVARRGVIADNNILEGRGRGRLGMGTGVSWMAGDRAPSPMVESPEVVDSAEGASVSSGARPGARTLDTVSSGVGSSDKAGVTWGGRSLVGVGVVTVAHLVE